MPERLAEVARRFGVKFCLSSPVSAINMCDDNSKATGVSLESGIKVEADVVVCNADLVYSYNNLLPVSRYAEGLRKKDTSCSSISFYWAMDQVIPELHAHNIFLAERYRESFDTIFKDQGLPDEPSFYVNVPSRIDPSAAPSGKDSIVVLCPVGHLLNDAEGKGISASNKQDWEVLISRARTAIFQTIQSRTGANIQGHIEHEIINTPQSWKDRFNLDKGGILGLSHSFFNVLCLRPHTRHDNIQGLYFVGASTHPGTGVPVVLAGGKVTSEQILRDLKMDIPWPPNPQATPLSIMTLLFFCLTLLLGASLWLWR